MSDKIQIKKELQGEFIILVKNVSYMAQIEEIRRRIEEVKHKGDKVLCTLKETYHLTDISYLLTSQSSEKQKAINEIDVIIDNTESFKNHLEIDDVIKSSVNGYLKSLNEYIENLKKYRGYLLTILKKIEMFKEKNKKMIDNK